MTLRGYSKEKLSQRRVRTNKRLMEDSLWKIVSYMCVV